MNGRNLIPRSLLVLALGLLASTPALADLAPHIMVTRASHTIEAQDQVGDLLVIDGRLDVYGVVRGYIFAVNSDVVIHSTAIVLKVVTLNAGSLELDARAVLPSRISLRDVAVRDGNGATISVLPGQTRAFSSTTLVASSQPLTAASEELMRQMLPFDRPVPRRSASIAQMVSWEAPGTSRERLARGESSMTVGGLVRLGFVSERVVDSFQAEYRGARGAIRFSAVKLRDESTGAAFWAQIEQVPESAVDMSVRSGLGDGAHWFFRHRNRYTLAWWQDDWFFAVETRLAADSASVIQQLNFLRQVVEQVRGGLLS